MLATKSSSCILLQTRGPLAWLCVQVLLKDVREVSLRSRACWTEF